MKNLKDVHVEYEVIISKSRVIKGYAKRIKEDIIVKKNIVEMGVKSERKPSNMKLH